MTDMTTSQTLWGGETEKAIGNFPVSGEPIAQATSLLVADLIDPCKFRLEQTKQIIECRLVT